MAGFTDDLERALLDHVFTDPAYVPPATWHLGLSSTTPTEAGGNFTEPVGGGYGRIATVAADWAPAAGSAPATKANAVVFSFTPATADWLAGVDMTHFGLFEAITGGAVKIFGPVTDPEPVLSGKRAVVPIGGCVIQLGDPGDVYT